MMKPLSGSSRDTTASKKIKMGVITPSLSEQLRTGLVMQVIHVVEGAKHDSRQVKMVTSASEC